MKFCRDSLLLYAVTDRSWIGKMSLYEQVEASLQGGVTCVQLREKNLCYSDFLAEAKAISALCRRYGVPLIVNDSLNVALESGADGIHIGQCDMKLQSVRKLAGKDFIVGVTVHTVQQAFEAKKDGADYIGLGAVFSTSTKTDVNLMSHNMLREICNAVDLPAVAIGGINKSNIMQLAGSGVSGIAVVSAIFGSDDIITSSSELLELSKRIVHTEEKR